MTKREKKLKEIIEIENNLVEIQDADILLEAILAEARRIVNADAGSIYVVSGPQNNQLAIKYSQNDSQQKLLGPGEKLPYLSFSFPIDKYSIAGYVGYTRKSLNIDNAYNMDENLPFKFNKQTDLDTNYHTQSMYTVPLKKGKDTLIGVLQIINRLDKNGKVTVFDDDDMLFLNHFASAASLTLQRAYNNQNMVKRMLKLSEFRDPKETYTHTERVSTFAVEIYDRWAFEHKVPEAEWYNFRDNLKLAAKFHDIGKVGISDVILKKQFPTFNDDERNIMKGHTCLGAMLFYPANSTLDKMIIDVTLCHHERWDGGERGYPGKFDLDRLVTYSSEDTLENPAPENKYEIGGKVQVERPLRGEEIPMSARIVAIADVFDALSHKRCYKGAWSLDEAFATIEKEAGAQFDPELVEIFMKLRDRITAIYLANPDVD